MLATDIVNRNAFPVGKLFQPPPFTPSTTPSTRIPRPEYRRNTGNDCSRKRARHSYISDSSATTPLQTPLNDWNQIPSVTSSAYFSPAPSPAPFVSTKYEMKGGLDTPGAAVEARYEEENDQQSQSEDLRPNRLRPSLPATHGYFPQTPNLTDDGSVVLGKRKQTLDNPGWTRSIVSTVGGIAWKGINFCFTTAFGGFHAGGGTGYSITTTSPTYIEGNGWSQVSNKEDVFDDSYEGPHYRESTPIPGQFPDDDENPEQMVDSIQRNQSSRKENKNSLSQGWTMISAQTTHQSSASPSQRTRRGSKPPPLTHKRTNSQASTAGMRSKSVAHPRPRLVSNAGSPSLPSSRTASYASPRSLRKTSDIDHSYAPSYRRSPSPSKPRASLTSTSFSSPRRSITSRDNNSNGGGSALTPTSPDVQRFQRQVRSKKKKEDEDIKRLNKQLRDMIRQGKEALGTKIDIEEEEAEEEAEEDSEEDNWK